MAKVKTGRGAFFLKYFSIFSGIVLLSFLIIGFALMMFVSGSLKTKNLDETSLQAKEIASTITEILDSHIVKDNPEGAALIILNSINLIADCNQSDVFICNKDGTVFACAHMLDGVSLSTSNCETHANFKLPAEYLQKVKRGSHTEFSTLKDLYPSVNSIALESITTDNEFAGFVVVAKPISVHIINNVRNIFKAFLIAAAIALLLVTIAVFVLTERIAKPIRNLETATRCYASGDFTYRVPELRSHDELADLITKFNAMATALSQLEDSRRSFVANVSHEFKTPMTTIGGFINGILDGTIPPEKQGYYLEIVSSEINRLSRMVNMMLNISKIETGNITMTMEKVDISPRLVSTFLGFEQIISNKKIEISGFEDLQSAIIHCDGAMIDQLIYNLVDNAVKFTNEGGKITVNTGSDKKSVTFSITNTGNGIPKKDLDMVFERFYKVDQSRSTDVKSTGLGLYLVKSIIDIHGGKITVESEVNNYTRFTVTLPK